MKKKIISTVLLSLCCINLTACAPRMVIRVYETDTTRQEYDLEMEIESGYVLDSYDKTTEDDGITVVLKFKKEESK